MAMIGKKGPAIKTISAIWVIIFEVEGMKVYISDRNDRDVDL